MTAAEIQPTLEFLSNNWELLSGLLIIGAIGLTFKQREQIRLRDENRCQSKDKRIKCGGRLEIDHIIAKEFAETALGMEAHNHGHLGYNDPPNLLTKCENHHRGHPNSHHPDVHIAKYKYQAGDHEAIGEAIQQHHEMAQEGKIYWNNENDRQDRITAIERSAAMDKKSGGRSKWWFWMK